MRVLERGGDAILIHNQRRHNLVFAVLTKACGCAPVWASSGRERYENQSPERIWPRRLITLGPAGKLGTGVMWGCGRFQDRRVLAQRRAAGQREEDIALPSDLPSSGPEACRLCFDGRPGARLVNGGNECIEGPGSQPRGRSGTGAAGVEARSLWDYWAGLGTVLQSGSLFLLYAIAA